MGRGVVESLPVGRRPVRPSHSRMVRLNLLQGLLARFRRSVECAALAGPRRAVDGCRGGGIMVLRRLGVKGEAKRLQESVRLGL
jgi:hypothetical protein